MSPMANGVFVFAGAAFGAALTVWLTNRAQDRREVEWAFRRLRETLYKLQLQNPSREQLDAAAPSFNSELSHIDHHARWPMRNAKKIQQANDDLANSLRWSYDGYVDWQPIRDALAALNDLLFNGNSIDSH